MSLFRLHRLFEFLASLQWVVALLWLGLAVFTVGLAVLMYSRWGQYRPLRKCMGLSLLAHLLLAGYSTTVQIMVPVPPPMEHVLRVSLHAGDSPTGDQAGVADTTSFGKGGKQPWEAFPTEAVAQPAGKDLDREATETHPEPRRVERAENAALPGNPDLGRPQLVEVKPPDAKPPPSSTVEQQRLSDNPAASIDAPTAQYREGAQPIIPGLTVSNEHEFLPRTPPVRTSSEDVPRALVQVPGPLPRLDDSTNDSPPNNLFDTLSAPRPNPMRPELVAPQIAAQVGEASADGDSVYSGAPRGPGDHGGEALDGRSDRLAMSSAGALRGQPGGTSLGRAGTRAGSPNLDHNGEPGDSGDGTAVPDAYRLRVAPNRAGVARQQGGSGETEAAVKAALKWLADNQAADGRWDPRAHDAGKDANVLGHTHESAGNRADTGITGLALLAFLAAGHTHRDGPYQETVRRGLEYLLQVQGQDGNLGGHAAMYEFMYCHAMATCALSEAYGMTRDRRLRGSVERAIAYTVRAQDPVGGGWRYRPGMAGDTSQLGWQVMALKSADLAGIPVAEQTRQGIIRYLRSVSSGKFGGKASYRPGEQATRTMSAEALVCWQFLGLPREHPACNEASEFMLSELPGEGVNNLYYWYYATLGMYQLQGTQWEQWNDALQRTLVGRQVKGGPMSGSWDNADDLWGGHGGRVYTTALTTLALEVYYRFLPLYSSASTAARPGAAKPQ